MNENPDIVQELKQVFGDSLVQQPTCDEIPTVWVPAAQAHDILSHLKKNVDRPFKMLFDLTAIDERERIHREGQPDSDFTVVYQLLSFDRNADVRVKVALKGDQPEIKTISDIWPNANWYEREAWDMFGVRFDGHPDLRRILLPPYWKGHALRKDHPARATEMGPYTLNEEKSEAEQAALQFHPEQFGLKRGGEDTDYVFLNIGPQHPGTHGVFRLFLAMDGEVILDVVPDIGFHHRGAEKMGERQSWHTYIPYTDRVDYLGGVMNNFPYVMGVEKLAGIQVPDRAKVIRIMLAELYRIYSHLVWYGTFAQDLGALSPVFYMFNDREKLLEIIEAVCGTRMHPGWFRIGGVAADLPDGWDRLVGNFLKYMPPKLDEYDHMVMQNRILKARTQGIGAFSVDEAIDWGATGAVLRSTGFNWDWRKRRPYSGYDQFEFDVPLGKNGDCYDRAFVKVGEMRQSLRIIKQCLDNMPAGPYKSDHPLTTPPLKPYTMHDIETLITHFLNVSWGPVIPAGEALTVVEATKGLNGYYLVSDGSTIAYRVRIRTPSFAHIQSVPLLSRGGAIPDLIAVLGSIDFVLADVDR